MSNIGAGLASLLFAILLSRTLGPDGKGLVTLMFIVPSLVSMAGDGGMGIHAVYSARKNFSQKNLVYSDNINWMVVFGFFSGIISWGVLNLSGGSGSIDRGSLIFSIFMTPMLLYIGLQRNLMLGINQVIPYNINNILQLVSVLIIACLLFWILNPSVLNAMMAYVLSLILVIIHMELKLKANYCGFSFDRIKLAMGYGLKGHLGTVIQYLNYRLDVLVLAYFTDAKTVGVYSVSYTCAEVLWRLPRAIGTVLFPSVAELGEDAANRLTNLVFKATNYILLLLCIVAAIFGYFFIEPIFGHDFSQAVNPFLILLPGVFFFSWHNTLIEDLKGRGMPGAKLFTAGIAAIFTLAGDFALIPTHGANGAALASSIAYLISGILSIYLYCRRAKVSVSSLVLFTREELHILTRKKVA